MVEVTKAQIEAWKKQYGEVSEISVKVSETDTAKCYLRPADGDRVVMSRALSLSSKQMPVECGEFILQNCWLGGDDRCKDFDNHGKIAIAAAIQTARSVDVLDGSLKKI